MTYYNFKTQDPREIIENETILYSLESTFAGISFFKKETPTLVFSYQFLKAYF